MSVLPHRYPILLVDRVLEIEPKKRIVAIKNVTVNEAVLPRPLPRPAGVARACCWSRAWRRPAASCCSTTCRTARASCSTSPAIEQRAFRRPVVPGDQVRYEVEVLRLRASYCKLAGRALVDGQLAAEAVHLLGDGGRG